jgi:hypothetical protein
MFQRSLLVFVMSFSAAALAQNAKPSDPPADSRTLSTQSESKDADPLMSATMVVSTVHDEMSSQEGMDDIRNCVSVFKDGHFVFEHIAQPWMAKGIHTQKMGTLTPEQMAELDKLLSAPEMVNFKGQADLSGASYFKDGEQLQAYIARPDSGVMQHIRAWSHFGGHRTNLQSGYNADADAFRVVKPLSEFMKKNVEKSKDAKKGKTNSICTDPLNLR